MYVFDHLPKTGGTTVRELLLQAFAGRLVVNVGTEASRIHAPKEITDQPSHALKHVDLLLAHGANRWRSMVADNAVWITVLRDPVARLISLWRYCQTTPETAKLHDVALSADVVQFVEQCKLANSVAEYFCGRIASYAVVGRQERLGKFFDRLRVLHGINCSYRGQRSNRSPVLTEIKQTEKQKLFELTAADRKFVDGVAGKL